MADLRLPTDVQDALAAFAAFARERFAGRVFRLKLFGSFARGQGDRIESDVDVLIAIEGLTTRELQEIVERGAELSSQYNVLLSPVAFAAADYRRMEHQELLLTREVARDGVAL